jgi:DNA helicase-2/ATP-dependent DNA helicase PcrA
MDGMLSALTDSQRQAVQHVDGPLLILAGPGSGKTRVVTHRIAHLLQQGIAGRNIVGLTFTNKAADEMRARLQQLVPDSGVWLGTFHRFGAQLLRRYAPLVGLKENFSIFDADDSLKQVKEALDEAGVQLIHETPQRVADGISWAKNDLVTSDQYIPRHGDPLGSFVARVYPFYQRRMLKANAADFDDLLLHLVVLLRENPELRAQLDSQFRYLLVDEYQDTNLAQYEMIRLLSIDYPNLAVTGDPDQSIYGWRGATIRNILEFESDFPAARTVRLEQNYRSTKNILRVADQLIENNCFRKHKDLYTDNPEGKPVRLTVYDTGWEEAQTITARIANEVSAGLHRYSDYAIFYRTNALSRTLERAMRSLRVPYQIVRGLEFYQRKEIKDILAYLHLLNNPLHNVALLRIINTPPRRIGKATVVRLNDHARVQDKSLLDAARESGMIEGLSKRAAVQVARFVAALDEMQAQPQEEVAEVIRRVLAVSGYEDWLKESDSEEDQERLANIHELVTDAAEFDQLHPEGGGLEAFLEETSLVSDVDDWNMDSDRVTMMTLHAAKGLEFPIVHIVAVEDNIIPHERNKADEKRIEEERRLLFVGITRAEEELHLSFAQQRSTRGRPTRRVASPFLMELPRDEMEIIGQLNLDAATPDEASQLEWEDDVPSFQVFDDDDPPGQLPEDEADTSSAAVSNPLMTAAELAGSKTTTPLRCSPNAFQQGMVVMHPKYGVGKIVSLAGSGPKRTANVQFASEPAPITFRLAYSPLRPAIRRS